MVVYKLSHSLSATEHLSSFSRAKSNTRSSPVATVMSGHTHRVKGNNYIWKQEPDDAGNRDTRKKRILVL